MRVTKATLEVINTSHGAHEFLNDDYHCSNVVQVGKVPCKHSDET